MIIRGEWGAHDAPYVRAMLVCARLGLRSPLTFLVDTGAAKTVIMDRDARNIGIDYGALDSYAGGTVGIGGRAETFVLRDAQLVFLSPRRRHIERLASIYVVRHPTATPDQRRIALLLPSILGRDVLNRHDVHLNRRRGQIRIRVRP